MSFFRTFVTRFGPWGLVGATVIILAALYLSLPLKHFRSQYGQLCHEMTENSSPADSQKLIKKFALTVFKIDVEPWKEVRRVSKWAGQIRIDARQIPKRFLPHLTRLLTQLSCLSGLDFRTENIGPRLTPNLQIIFPTPEAIDLVVRDANASKADAAWFRQEFNCIVQGSFKVSRKAKRIFDVTILIRSDLPDLKTRRCLVEEITQSLGLFADSEIIEQSVFRDEGPDLDYLPLNDKILVRTLYDKRIKHGMARDDAMKVAAEIIPELVAAVKEKGVEALYQQ